MMAEYEPSGSPELAEKQTGNAPGLILGNPGSARRVTSSSTESALTELDDEETLLLPALTSSSSSSLSLSSPARGAGGGGRERSARRFRNRHSSSSSEKENCTSPGNGREITDFRAKINIVNVNYC